MATCYRHPSRETNVSCSNCGRPICPDCMTTTSVGMRCPECAKQRTEVRNPIGAPGRSDAPATYAIIAACVLAFVAEIVGGGGVGALDGGGTIFVDFGLFGPAVADGEPYRIVTSAFLHAGILHLGLNMFALYVLGTLLEPAIGTARFVGIYLVSLLGGAFGALLLDPTELTVGASGGIFGLMAAALSIARDRGLDELASQVGFFVVINLVFTFVDLGDQRSAGTSAGWSAGHWRRSSSPGCRDCAAPTAPRSSSPRSPGSAWSRSSAR